MKHLLTIVVVLVFAFSVSNVFAQGQDFTLNGNGARAAGMGYAFTGLADDASAISWNAAGLTQLYSMEASAVFRFGFGSMDANYSIIDASIERGSEFQFNFGSFVVPFQVGNLNMAAGVAYRRVYDFTVDQTLTLSYQDLSAEMTETNTGGVDAISPAIGVQLNDMISVGATFNILTGSTDYETSILDWNGFEDSYSYSEEYSGLAIDIGILARPSSNFSIGANLSLPSTMTIKFEDAETELAVPFFFSLGAAFKPTDAMTLAFDYRSRAWSNLEVDGEAVDGVEDVNSIHVGLEYLIQSGSSVLPLRLGFYTAPTPETDWNDDQISFNVITAGTGIVMGNIILDAAFEYQMGSFIGDEDVNGNEVTYDVNDFRFTVGSVIHFGK